VRCCCEKLVVEAGDSLGTQMKGDVRRWKPLLRNDSEGVIVNTILCVYVCVGVTLYCKMYSRVVLKSLINSIANTNPVYNHSIDVTV
jgi:hypothetical protein